MHMAPIDDLFRLERELDDLALHTRLTDLPRRAALTGLLSQAHSVIYGGVRTGLVARPAVGRTMISRYSYLLNVLDRCPEEPVGASAADALSPFTDDVTLLHDQLYLVQYGHVCELLPEVRRGWYVVTTTDEGFRLDHPSNEFAAAEARDTVLADVTLPYAIRPPANDILFDAACVKKALEPSVIAEIVEYAEHFRHSDFEVALFPDAAWQEAFGVTEDDFLRFQAFWLALSEAWLRMGEAVRRRLTANPDDEALGDEYLEWVVPYLDHQFVAGLASATTDISGDAYDRLMQFYSHTTGSAIGGDGFFPPLHPLGDGLLFAPAAVQLMLGSRNVAYGLNRADPDRFAAVLSDHLEPFLLSKADSILSRLGGVEVRTNVSWPEGEIDLLAYDPALNVALHVQAKAPVPPQGARMTRAVETRAREGLSQLARFRALPQAEIDRIVGSAFERRVADVGVFDMLLVRTCLGTQLLWAELGGVAPANLHVLAAAVDRIVERNAGLPELPAEVTRVLDQLVAEIADGWERESVDYELARIEMPLLSLNEERTALWRARLHRLVG